MGLEISRIYTSDEPNPMVYHRNISLSSDEGNSKASKPDPTKNICLVTLDRIILFTPEKKKFCHAQVIMTKKDLGENWDLTYPLFS